MYFTLWRTVLALLWGLSLPYLSCQIHVIQVSIGLPSYIFFDLLVWDGIFNFIYNIGSLSLLPFFFFLLIL